MQCMAVESGSCVPDLLPRLEASLLATAQRITEHTTVWLHDYVRSSCMVTNVRRSRRSNVRRLGVFAS